MRTLERLARPDIAPPERGDEHGSSEVSRFADLTVTGYIKGMGGGVPPTVSVIFKEKEVKKIPVSVKSDDHNEAESHLCFSAAILLISVMVRAFYGSLTIFIYILNSRFI